MSTHPYPLGRLEATDPRDRAYPMRLALPGAPKVRRRRWTPGPVLDQGDRPHCVAYSWTGLLQATPVPRAEPPVAPAILYALAQELDEIPGEDYDGSTVRGGAKAVERHGLLSRYVWAWTAADVVAWLLTSGTVVLGTTWFDAMFTPDPDGRLRIKGAPAGGHAYLAIGCDLDRVDREIEIRNSWGAGWGRKGNAYLSLRDLGTLLGRYRGEACGAVERRK